MIIVENGETFLYKFFMQSVSSDAGVASNSGNIQLKMSKGTGSIGNVSNTLTDLSGGWYSFTLSTSDTNTDGVLVIEAHDTAGTATMRTWRDMVLVATTLPAALSSTVMDSIADHVIRRDFENACDSSDGDTKTFRSLLGAVAKQVNKTALSGTTLTIYEDDDSTSLGTQTISTGTGPANPVIGLDTN